MEAELTTEGVTAVEMLDVVDGRNQVVGQASRAEVHRRGLKHRAVHMLIEDPRGRLYLQRRAAHKDCDAGLWDTSAAGHVEAGEDYQTAALRELGEELGLTDVSLAPLCELPALAATGEEFVQVYRGCTNCEPRPDPREIAAGGWWSRAEIVAWMARDPVSFTATFKLIFARLQAQGTEA